MQHTHSFNISVTMATYSFPVPLTWFQYFSGSWSLEDIKQGHELNLTYLNACWIMQETHHWQ